MGEEGNWSTSARRARKAKALLDLMRRWNRRGTDRTMTLGLNPTDNGGMR